MALSKVSSMATSGAAGGGEEGGGDGGPVAAGAVHPDLSVGHLVDALGQLVEREC